MSKIGVQLYTLREFLKTKEEIINTLEKVKRMGFSVVQVSGIKSWTDPEIIDTITDICQKLDIEICVTHIPFESLQKDLSYFIELHKKWRCPYIGIGRIPDNYRNNPSVLGYIEFAKALNKIAKKLKEHDMKIVYHNHEFEFMLFNNKPLMDILIENTHKKNVHLEIDVHWVWRGGYDPCLYLKKLKNRIDVIHLKDYVVYHSGADNRSEIRYGEIGSGSLDMTKIIRTALKSNVKYMLIEQDDTYGKDPFVCLQESYDHLVALGFGDLF